MNVKAMRRVDSWIGVPICAVLTLARRIGDLFGRTSSEGPPRRIAVIKLAEQGATVLAYPALAKAREMVGSENLFFVVFTQNRFILDLLDVVPKDNVITIRTDGAVRLVTTTLRAVLRMRREKIDAAIDFEFFARSSAILAYLSGAKRRVGFHAYSGEASYRGDLMTHRLSFNSFLHAAEIFKLQVQALELPADKLPACDLVPDSEGQLPRYQPDPETTASTEKIVRETLKTDRVPPLFLLNANCSDLLPLRRWPRERYIELTRRLLERFPEAAVAYTGAPDEAPESEELVAAVGSARCVSLAGKTSLPQLIALYGLAELMVTNDSGPAHYATLMPIDVITMFGPETPAAFGARTPRSHILWAGLACSPCVNAFNDRLSHCRDNVCMQRITVDRVFELACEVFERRRAGRSGGDETEPGQDETIEPDSPNRSSASSSSGVYMPENRT